MPVSSPSYFPPNTSTDQVTGINAGRLATGAPHFLAGANAGNNSTAARLIIIGDNSGKGGITAAGLAGTIILGCSSAETLTSIGGGGTPSANIIIGDGSLTNVIGLDSTIAIGQGIYPTIGVSGTFANVLIGNGIAGSANATASDITESVIIGHGVMPGGAGGMAQNVLIGSQIFLANTGGPTNNVFIGYKAGSTVTSGQPTQQNVVIGSQATIGTSSIGNVVIGNLASAAGAVSGAGQNIVIGSGASGTNSGDTVGQNICIGRGSTPASGQTTGNNVIIGPFAGKSLVGTTVGTLLVIETNNTGNTAQKCLVFGNFSTGNLILGGSKTGTSQDFGGTPGTNMVKLVNGTAATGAAITNGGYFYVLAGVLHWADSSGNDTTLSVPSAPTTGASTATFVATNKPGATTGAGPVAWANVVVNGVSYQSPLWAT